MPTPLVVLEDLCACPQRLASSCCGYGACNARSGVLGLSSAEPLPEETLSCPISSR